jgi:hypothetical protein
MESKHLVCSKFGSVSTESADILIIPTEPVSEVGEEEEL